jgi:hypothetical protein
VAVSAGVVLLLFTLSRDATTVGWSLFGWLIMAMIGVIGGSLMEAAHGKPGTAFVGILVGSMLARLMASGLGAVAATTGGYEAAWPYLAGIVAGFVPLQVFEVIWFFRKGRRQG